jgi:hypothetical protein
LPFRRIPPASTHASVHAKNDIGAARKMHTFHVVITAEASQ